MIGTLYEFQSKTIHVGNKLLHTLHFYIKSKTVGRYLSL